MQARFVQFHQVFAERHGWIYCSPSHWNFSVYWEGSERGGEERPAAAAQTRTRASAIVYSVLRAFLRRFYYILRVSGYVRLVTKSIRRRNKNKCYQRVKYYYIINFNYIEICTSKISIKI